MLVLIPLTLAHDDQVLAKVHILNTQTEAFHFELDLMKLLANLDHLYEECKRNLWLHYFAVFCRVALALGFIPSGIEKVMGERFTALPSNHPLGHYFDALHLTGFYYTFIGVSQLTVALLLAWNAASIVGSSTYTQAFESPPTPATARAGILIVL